MNVSVTKVKATTSTMGLVMYAAYGRGDGQKTKTDRNDLLSFVGSNRATTAEGWGVQVREDWRASVAAQKAGQKRKVESYHYIQSWSKDELDGDRAEDVEKAHAAGLEFANRVAPNSPVMVATQHDGKGRCLHNHIIIGNLDWDTGKALPKEAVHHGHIKIINDDVMRDFGLEVLDAPEVKMSTAERRAEREGRSCESEGLSVDQLTDETYRDFIAQRVADVVDDDNVVDLETAQKIAPAYGLEIQIKVRRGKEHLSYALIDDDGAVRRIPKKESKGTVKAALAGSKLGEDYRTEGLIASIEAKQAALAQQQDFDGIGYDQSGLEELSASIHAISSKKEQNNAESITHQDATTTGTSADPRPVGRGGFEGDKGEHVRPETDGEFAEGVVGEGRGYLGGPEQLSAEYESAVQRRKRADQRRKARIKSVADSLDRLGREAGSGIGTDGTALHDHRGRDGIDERSQQRSTGVRSEVGRVDGSAGQASQRGRSERQRADQRVAEGASRTHRNQPRANETQRRDRWRNQRDDQEAGRRAPERGLELDF